MIVADVEDIQALTALTNDLIQVRREMCSQRELSEVTGITIGTIRGIESQRFNTPITTLMKYASGLGYQIKLSIEPLD